MAQKEQKYNDLQITTQKKIEQHEFHKTNWREQIFSGGVGE